MQMHVLPPKAEQAAKVSFFVWQTAPRLPIVPSMNAPYILHYAPDNASLIIRLALDELGLPYTTALVDRAAMAQRTPKYLALNPHGLIPVLETPEGAIFETGAILLWLCETHDTPIAGNGCTPLAPPPKSPARADFLKWLFFTSNTLHAHLRMLFYPEKYTASNSDKTTDAQIALRAQIQQNLIGHLTSLDDLAATRPTWFCGDAISVLDIYVAVCLRWMALYPKGDTVWFTLSNFAHLHALAARIETRHSMQIAMRDECLGATPITNPSYATPTIGSAT